MGDAAGSAVAGPKKAKPRGSAASSEPVGFRARVVERLNAFEEPAPAKGKAKAKDEQWKYLVLGALDSDQELAGRHHRRRPRDPAQGAGEGHTSPARRVPASPSPSKASAASASRRPSTSRPAPA